MVALQIPRNATVGMAASDSGSGLHGLVFAACFVGMEYRERLGDGTWWIWDTDGFVFKTADTKILEFQSL